MKSVVLNGFGISIMSDVDFDVNGYNDILIGSYLSENAVLLRTKPIANMNITDVTFRPNKIRLHDKKCNNNQNSCFKVEYCVKYEGRSIRDKQLALITLEITDSKLRIDFEHGCQSRSCLSRLRLTAVSKYSGQRIERNLIEGLHDTIDIEISVV
ncbi:unnamed protein product, partial [Oppiella nova]